MSRITLSRYWCFLLLFSAVLETQAAFTSRPPLQLHPQRHPTLILSPFGQQRFPTQQLRPIGSRIESGPCHHLTVVSALPSSFSAAWSKFRARPGTYLLIPCVAALVGWFTNYLAVQMIFYPIEFRGIPIYTRPEVPLGLLGWQGIVPCKTRPMAQAMVDMVTTQLLPVREAFAKLDPHKVADLLSPRVPILAQDIANDVLPKWVSGLPAAVLQGLPVVSKGILHHFNTQFLTSLVRDMQQNIDSVFDINNCVINQMLEDRRLLGQLFRKCGQAELDFLTNSGLWFGFMLGLIQMVVALFWSNPWTLSIGGGIVGLATNWLALKWIFEPVNPTKIGPFLLQGKFLRRQPEVSREFSKFFATRILTSERVWNSILTDPTTTPAFHAMFGRHFGAFVNRVTRGLCITPEPEVVQMATQKAIEKLPDHVGVLHGYVDKTLDLETTLRVRMERMTSSQFERVLHPIFEEDELTLILAGAGLGFAAGLIQQGLETGQIRIPNFWGPLQKRVSVIVKRLGVRLQKILSVIHLRRRSRRKNTEPDSQPDDNDPADR